MDEGEEEYGEGKVPEQNEKDGEEDEELQERADEVCQDGAEDEYLAGDVDLGHQTGLAHYGLEGSGGARSKEAPCHDAHEEVDGEVRLLTEEVPEDEPEDE